MGPQPKHVGAQSELIACAWLLERGYEVYRNVSGHRLADIAVYDPNDGTWFLVDVKSNRRYATMTADQDIHGVRFLAVTADGRCHWIDKPHRKPEPTAHQKRVAERKQLEAFRAIHVAAGWDDDDDAASGSISLTSLSSH
jgi:hypothetical protein